MNTAQTKLTVGTLVKFAGVKEPLLVTEKCAEAEHCYMVAGPRGAFMITDCITHWVRWPLPAGRRNRLTPAPREVKIEWTKLPVEA